MKLIIAFLYETFLTLLPCLIMTGCGQMFLKTKASILGSFTISFIQWEKKKKQYSILYKKTIQETLTKNASYVLKPEFRLTFSTGKKDGIVIIDPLHGGKRIHTKISNSCIPYGDGRNLL